MRSSNILTLGKILKILFPHVIYQRVDCQYKFKFLTLVSDWHLYQWFQIIMALEGYQWL